MKTLLTIKQQHAFMSNNRHLETIRHRWSTRGYGNSRLFDNRGNQLAFRSGCGYDRFGAVLGDFIESTFPNALLYLAIRESRGRHATRRGCPKFYGLFYNKKENRAYLDGACGENCMRKVLKVIGFDLVFVGRAGNDEFYQLRPISKHSRKYL